VQALSEHGYDVLSGTEQTEQEMTQHSDGPE
jgi:hypothetical protein